MSASVKDLEKNPYLNGNFAALGEELSEPCKLVEGSIPEDINGYFLRIGPNPQFAPREPQKYHWFDGDGMVHQIRFSQGRAHYKNRWVRSKGFNIEREAGKSIWKGFQSLHELEFHHGMMTKNVANTAMVWHQQKLLALWEAGVAHQLSLESLETIGEETFQEQWSGALSAHPKVCPRKGELIAFAYNVTGDYGFTYGVFNDKGELKHKADIRLQGKPVMIHDCAITENYTLILDMPVTFSLERAMAGGAAFAWEPDNGARIGLLPRYGNYGDVRWFEVQAGFIFHVFNAWEEEDEVVLEACRSNCSSVISDAELGEQYSIEDEQGKAHQYRFNLISGEVFEQSIDDVACEFARINEQYSGMKNRFCYASRFNQGNPLPLFDGLIKFDRQKNSKALFAFPDQVFGGEFIFVSREQPDSEDDGYLMGFVHNEASNESELYIVDAKKFTEGPVARIRMSHRVPYGFHAAWVAASDVK